jgi:CRISPR-associated RAMP protein (TIGR02581 family)
MVFEKLAEIVEIQVEYESKSSLAIQAGREEGLSAVEQPVVKIGGTPVIPGSTLKGVLRSFLESYLSQNGLEICVPLAAIPGEIKRSNKIGEYVQKIGRKSPCEGEKACPVCQIFGSAGISSRTSFLDARPINEVKILDRKHVALERDTKTASKGALLEIQTIEPGAKFNGLIRIINPEKWHIGALIIAIENLEKLGMGSKKSAGYGEIVTEVIKITTKKMENGEWQEIQVTKEEYRDAFLKYLRDNQ